MPSKNTNRATAESMTADPFRYDVTATILSWPEEYLSHWSGEFGQVSHYEKVIASMVSELEAMRAESMNQAREVVRNNIDWCNALNAQCSGHAFEQMRKQLDMMTRGLQKMQDINHLCSQPNMQRKTRS